MFELACWTGETLATMDKSEPITIVNVLGFTKVLGRRQGQGNVRDRVMRRTYLNAFHNGVSVVNGTGFTVSPQVAES